MIVGNRVILEWDYSSPTLRIDTLDGLPPLELIRTIDPRPGSYTAIEAYLRGIGAAKEILYPIVPPDRKVCLLINQDLAKSKGRRHPKGPFQSVVDEQELVEQLCDCFGAKPGKVRAWINGAINNKKVGILEDSHEIFLPLPNEEYERKETRIFKLGQNERSWDLDRNFYQRCKGE